MDEEEKPFDTTLEIECTTRDGLFLDVATVMTTSRVRVKEFSGKDLPNGRSILSVTFEVKNVKELEAIRGRVLNVRDVISTRRGAILCAQS